MIQTYLKASEPQAFAALLATMANVIGPIQGAPAHDEGEGNASPAKGDPSKHYVCVLAPFSVPAFGGLEACDEAEGRDVCGVWA